MIPASMLRLGSGLLLPLLAAASGYALGCGQSRHYWQTKLQAAVAEMQAADSRAQQQRQAAALEQQRQWRQRTDQLESRLLLQQQALQAQQRRQAQRIDDVTRNDGSRFTGLGPDSLRLYRQLLGYSDPLPGAQSLPAGAAAQTAGPDAGLPASDLLAHAADYGDWCQQLEQRLVALKQLYSQETTP